MLRCRVTLRLLLIATLLAGAGMTAPAPIGEPPAVRADDGKDESGRGGDDGDRQEDAVEQAADYRVEVDCAYDEAADETTCTFAGLAPPGAKDVSHVDLPAREVCAEVVGGDHEYVDPDPNTRVVGYKSRGSEGAFTLVMAGAVTTGGTATYWFKTGDGVFPATGPGLRCGDATKAAGDADPDEGEAVGAPNVQAAPAGAADADTSGTIVVQTYACGAAPDDPDAFDWYGACEPGADGVPFALKAEDGSRFVDAGDGATDEEGTLRFEGLAPGTYQLRGLDVVWCHAESDGVDARGDLVVEAGQRVTVWIFLCGEGASA